MHINSATVVCCFCYIHSCWLVSVLMSVQWDHYDGICIVRIVWLSIKYCDGCDVQTPDVTGKSKLYIWEQLPSIINLTTLKSTMSNTYSLQGHLYIKNTSYNICLTKVFTEQGSTAPNKQTM